LAAALSVEPGELTNEGGVTILEEREGNRVRMVRQYDDFTLERSYDTSRLDEVYRLILEGWLGGVPETHARPRGDVRSRAGRGISLQGNSNQTNGRGIRTRPTHNVCDTWLSQDWRETAYPPGSSGFATGSTVYPRCGITIPGDSRDIRPLDSGVRSLAPPTGYTSRQNSLTQFRMRPPSKHYPECVRTITSRAASR
jgi:hypothetical protein